MRAASQSEPLGQTLPHLLEEFLAGTRDAVVMEDGQLVFDLATARYSVSADHGKCLLHLWSSDRNTVRRVLAVEHKSGILRMDVQRFGQARPSRMEICLVRDRRSPSTRKATRSAYQQRLHAVLEREFAGWHVERLTTAMDLEKSFGPVYARGVLRHGASAFAVLGVNAQESQAAVDAAVAFGVLWLDHLRERLAMSAHVEGLKLFVPRGGCTVAAARMAHLHAQAAKWQLFEFDERAGEIEPVDCADRGNIATRLVHAASEEAAHERFAQSIARVRALAKEAEIAVLAASAIAFRVHGLEFARARLAPAVSGFQLEEEIVFGAGACETVLSDETAPIFHRLVARILSARRRGGDRNHALWRMHPERWLESLVVRDVAALDSTLDPAFVYSQVPAFAAHDRGMIDVLTVTREGRLAVIELKAEEDPQLPLQGLDYWSRVHWHNQRGEFQQFGYFPGVALSPRPPLLLLAAPALHLHPTTDTLLRYLAPEVDITIIGLDERWRDGLRVVFRKRARAQSV